MLRCWQRSQVASGRRLQRLSSGPASPLWDRAETYEHAGGRGQATLGTGRLAGLAHGAVVGQDGGSVVLATVVSERYHGPPKAGDDGDSGTPFTVTTEQGP